MVCCMMQVHEGTCVSLKRHKLDVERVGKGNECGVLLEGYKVSHSPFLQVAASLLSVSIATCS